MQPVVIGLIAYVVGLVCGSFLGLGTSPIFVWSLPFVSAFLWYVFRGRYSANLVFLCLAFLLVGLLRVSLSLNPPADISQVHFYCGPSPVVVEGTVLQVNSRGPEKSSVDIAASLITSRGIAVGVTGRVRLYLGSGRTRLLNGDRVRFRSRLRRPRVFGVPGEFDMPRHFAYSKIWTTAYLSDSGALVRLASGEEGFLRQIARWRQQCSELIDQSVADEVAPFVKALSLGERGAISVSQRQQLARGGVAHLFAISGLHMGLLAMFGYQILLFGYRRSSRLLRWQPPQRVLPLLLIPLLFGYLMLTGDALSTRRAFSVCLCLAIFLLWKRRVSPLQLLCSLALSFLLLEPLALWQASFQLSFAGVAGILCWKRYWQLPNLKQPWFVKKILQIFLISLAATLATAPLVLLNFHLFSPAGLVNNLFAIPLVTLLAVPAGLVGVLLTSFWPLLAGFAYLLCGQVLELTIFLTELVTALPGMGGEVFYQSQMQLLLISVMALVLLFPWQRFIYPLLILSVLLLFYFAPRDVNRESLSLVAFSVGQGESMLLSVGDSTHILVDGGGLYSDTFDVGERLLAPALGFLGVKRLDAVLLTHDHPDHSKGILYLLEHFPVDSFWCGTDPKRLSQPLRQTLVQQQVPVRQFPVGWTAVSIDDHGTLNLYVPDLERGSKNDRSVAAYVNYGEDGLLLTGDLEHAGTEALLNAGVPGPVSLLKLPHHGSRNSGSRLLLEKFHPQKAVVSVGYQNRYGLPAAEVVEDVQKGNVALYRTDLSGTVRFYSRGEGWQVEQWRNGLFR